MPYEDEDSFKFLTENSADMIFRSDFTPKITYISPSSMRLLGYNPEELLGMGPDFLVAPQDFSTVITYVDALRPGGVERQDAPNLTVRMIHKDRSLVWVEMSARLIIDPETGGPIEMIIVARDVSERKQLEEQLLAMALTDGLTGLLNRRAFDDELEREWNRVIREESHVSLVLLDIDHFKRFNDDYGHLAGDDCLRVVGAAVKSAVRVTDMVARYGGEELAIILPATDYAGAHTVAEMARRAIENLDIPHARNSEGNQRVTASLGVATALARIGGGIRMPESLVLSADKALYMAKHDGRNCVRKVMMMAAANKLSEVA